MSKIVGRWVVYELKNGEFLYLSKLFKTKREAEDARSKLTKSQAGRRGRKASGTGPGVGFIKQSG